MAAEILDGKAVAAEVQDKLRAEVREITPRLGRSPGLAVVLVGDNPASQVYVRSKTKKAEQCGIEVTDLHLPGDVSNEELQKHLKELSANEKIDGILLQLPLPKGLDEFSALLCIEPSRDVDGLHPFTQGLLLRSQDCHQPCTPKGCVMLIEQARERLGQSRDLTGLHAVVVGRSILVGKPMGLLLLDKNCTVTMCHSRTKNLVEECRKADILVLAVGRERLITAEHIKPGAIVIDVGINRSADGSLVGDVDFESAAEVAGAITPVPGGVGPMTIAMLLKNTVESARRKIP